MQYRKLFEKADVEYITPFLKIWMAFNNWYQIDLKNQSSIKTDKDAINYYKKYGGKVGKEFMYFFDANTLSGVDFGTALYDLITHLAKYPLQDKKGQQINYSSHLIKKEHQGGNQEELIYISAKQGGLQVHKVDREQFFQETLEIVYQIRSALVHGNFDIENQDFIRLVESVYKIMYPIMNRIFEKEQAEDLVCRSAKKKVDAVARMPDGFGNNPTIVLAGSKVCTPEQVVDSYGYGKETRETVLNENAKYHQGDGYYVMTNDYLFSSPSAASSFCLGNNSDGMKVWKNRNGEILEDLF